MRTSLGQPTKQDFIAIARIFCGYKVNFTAVKEIAYHFKKRNPNFDRDRFLSAAVGAKCKVMRQSVPGLR